MVVTLLHNWEGDVTVDEQNVWANVFELHHPVLEDQDSRLSEVIWPGAVGRPKSVLLGPGAEILMFSPKEEDVAAALGG